MPTTSELAHALADANPPTPGADARAAVARRSTTLVRRRRFARGVGALTCTAALAAGVVALTDAPPASRGTVEAGAELPADSPAAGARLSVATGDAVPTDVELDVVLTGEAGTHQGHVRTPGTLALDAVAPGDYELRWSWASDDATAAGAGHVAVHIDGSDLTVTLGPHDPSVP